MRTCASALAKHTLCRTHLVWVSCCEVDTETLSKAKACLLPSVRCSMHLPLTATLPECKAFHGCQEIAVVVFKTSSDLHQYKKYMCLANLPDSDRLPTYCIIDCFTWYTMTRAVVGWAP